MKKYSVLLAIAWGLACAGQSWAQGKAPLRLVPELNRHHVGVPGKDAQTPQILVYEVMP